MSTVETQRQALLEALNEYLSKVLAQITVVEGCIASYREDGHISSASTQKAVHSLSSLEKQAVKLVEKHCTTLGADGLALIDFVKTDYKICLNSMAEKLKVAEVENGNSSTSSKQHQKNLADLEKLFVEFRKFPRQLVDKARDGKFEASTSEKEKANLGNSKTALKSSSPKKKDKKEESKKEESSDVTDEDEEPSPAKGKGKHYGNRRLSINVKSPDHGPSKEKGEKGGKVSENEKGEKGKDRATAPLKSPRAPGFRKDGSARPTLQKVGKTVALDRLVQDSGARIPGPKEQELPQVPVAPVKEKPAKKEPKRASTVSGTARPSKEAIEEEMKKLKMKTATTKKAGDIETEVNIKPDEEDDEPKGEPKPKEQPKPKLTNGTNPNKISIFIGMDTDPGKRYGKLNQDSNLYCRTGARGHVAAVFDGHGVNGEVAADLSKETFREFFESRDFWSYPLEARRKMLDDVFVQAHKNIINKYGELAVIKWEGHRFQLENIRGLMMYKNKKFGALLQDFGTTAVVAILNTDETGKVIDIMTANVGDSIAFVGRETTKNPIGLRAMHGLIEMHNGANVREEKRITALGSRLTDGDYIAPPEDSGFGWAQLAVTRSLGHRYFSDYGVIANPFVSEYEIHRRDRYLVITSDGVTDVLSSKEILKAVKELASTGPPNDMQYVASKLVRHSLAMWRKRFGEDGEPADNTTAIVIDLKAFKTYYNGKVSSTSNASTATTPVSSSSSNTPQAPTASSSQTPGSS